MARLWKETFLHCLASAEAACESSLLNRLSRAKLLKPLSTAYSDGACVCVRARHRHWCGFKMLALFVFEQIYHCGFFSESGSSSSTVLLNTAMQDIHLHCTHWLCIPNRMCVQMCVSGSYFPVLVHTWAALWWEGNSSFNWVSVLIKPL